MQPLPSSTVLDRIHLISEIKCFPQVLVIRIAQNFINHLGEQTGHQQHVFALGIRTYLHRGCACDVMLHQQLHHTLGHHSQPCTTESAEKAKCLGPKGERRAVN